MPNLPQAPHTDEMPTYTRQHREFHYHWRWKFDSPPEKLWPWVSNTDRFNRDTHLPTLTLPPTEATNAIPGYRHLKFHRLNVLGLKAVPIEWYEEPFEWVKDKRFDVIRHYIKGPVKSMRVACELEPLPEGGTAMSYQVWIRPSSWLGYPAVVLQVGLLSAQDFKRTFKQYDRWVQANKTPEEETVSVRLSKPAEITLEKGRQQLLAKKIPAPIVDALLTFVRTADTMSLRKIRPYALADLWKFSRRETLDACLYATRLGILDLRWELLCPLCRGAKEVTRQLGDVNITHHCDSCQIDYEINFDLNVEVVFSVNPSIRQVETEAYCIGGPQVTPHIEIQQQLSAGEQRQVMIAGLESGRYRFRTARLRGGAHFIVDAKRTFGDITITAQPDGWANEEQSIPPNVVFLLNNQTEETQTFILERLRWNDNAVTAAEVTSLQVFRDLFSNQILRPDMQMTVGSLTVVFTDLLGSTQMYRDIGDAPAFGVVLDHFDVLRDCIAEAGGAVVKTMGDAVMAVFRDSASAVQAMLKARQILANPPVNKQAVAIKIGIHRGTSIAVTLNERLDYFGTTVNIAARISHFSTGADVILSHTLLESPEVNALIYQNPAQYQVTSFSTPIKGFGEDQFELYRVTDVFLSEKTYGHSE